MMASSSGYWAWQQLPSALLEPPAWQLQRFSLQQWTSGAAAWQWLLEVASC
jgi:hypothetical protein